MCCLYRSNYLSSKNINSNREKTPTSHINTISTTSNLFLHSSYPGQPRLPFPFPLSPFLTSSFPPFPSPPHPHPFVHFSLSVYFFVLLSCSSSLYPSLLHPSCVHLTFIFCFLLSPFLSSSSSSSFSSSSCFHVNLSYPPILSSILSPIFLLSVPSIPSPYHSIFCPHLIPLLILINKFPRPLFVCFLLLLSFHQHPRPLLALSLPVFLLLPFIFPLVRPHLYLGRLKHSPSSLSSIGASLFQINEGL